MQVIAQAIGRAFQEAYFQFLRESGVEDPETFQEQNYQNILNSQEIFRNELAFFSDKEQEKEASFYFGPLPVHLKIVKLATRPHHLFIVLPRLFNLRHVTIPKLRDK